MARMIYPEGVYDCGHGIRVVDSVYDRRMQTPSTCSSRRGGPFVKDEFEAFLECGILAHGFLRVRCVDCAHEKLVAFSCKRRGFCPSCGARRIAQSAAVPVDEVIPQVPVRQWVLSFPIGARRRH